ncbi:hypothetical protein CUMW_099530 [Citrus unshiu]|nr:hypothetical protein CUMW_099530 [Citrus unshiu]
MVKDSISGPSKARQLETEERNLRVSSSSLIRHRAYVLFEFSLLDEIGKMLPNWKKPRIKLTLMCPIYILFNSTGTSVGKGDVNSAL